MEVKLLEVNKEEVINKLYVACRTCYSAGTPQEQWEKVNEVSEEKKLKLIKHVLDSRHHSVLEHQQFTFLISGVSRACSMQFIRHRMSSFCVSGDTKVRTGRLKNRPISELYKLPKQYKDMLRIRCFDEVTHKIESEPIAEIVYSGKKEVYEIKTALGYSLKSTLEHRFWTPDGWKQLSELEIGKKVYTNGIPAYQDKEWLRHQYNELNRTLADVANECGVTTHTIRKWARIHGVQKEIGMGMLGREPVNKGKNKFNYEPMRRTSEKMMGNNNCPHWYGSDNPAWAGDNITNSGGYIRTHKKFNKKGVCSICGYIGTTELHHIDKDPKNISDDNVIELCLTCHKKIHKKECKVIREDIITSIEYAGVEDTYDISMAGEHHNFIANGFAVHNSQQSQRYCGFKDGRFDYVIPKEIEKNDYLRGLFVGTMEHLADVYKKFIDCGVAAEDARAVLPNACTTNLTWSCNIRELMHVASERKCMMAQEEIRNLVNLMVKEVVKELPFLKEYLVEKCSQLGYCPENKKRSCGRKPTKDEVFKKS